MTCSRRSWRAVSRSRSTCLASETEKTARPSLRNVSYTLTRLILRLLFFSFFLLSFMTDNVPHTLQTSIINSGSSTRSIPRSHGCSMATSHPSLYVIIFFPRRLLSRLDLLASSDGISLWGLQDTKATSSTLASGTLSLVIVAASPFPPAYVLPFTSSRWSASKPSPQSRFCLILLSFSCLLSLFHSSFVLYTLIGVVFVAGCVYRHLSAVISIMYCSI